MANATIRAEIAAHLAAGLTAAAIVPLTNLSIHGVRYHIAALNSASPKVEKTHDMRDQVAELMSESFGIPQIATKLNIHVATVRHHVSMITKGLGAQAV